MVKRFGQDYEYEPTRMIQKDEGPYVLYNDYATLAAAARRLVDAMQWKVEAGEYYDFCIMLDEVLDTDAFSTGKGIEEIYQSATKEYLAALTELEQILGETK